VKCAIIFEREEVADRVPHRNLSLDEDRQAIDRALRALRTFKSGSVIVRQLHQAVTGFWPGIPLATGMILDRALVTAPWAIGVDEAAELALHAERLASDIEPSLELACSRLADAETRTLPRDALLDAAIGLEAILLHERSAEHRYKGEMRYRFAMHYAALAPPRERRAAFHLARDLYDARSAVAHGSTEEGFRMGDCKDASMASVAGTAKAMLRDVIMRFLPTASRPAYTSEAYWPDLLLGPRDQP
jgi:hypothetical protein